MKRCSHCVLTEKMPNITFDSKGQCNYCNNAKKMELKGEEKLIELLNSIHSPEKNTIVSYR